MVRAESNLVFEIQRSGRDASRKREKDGEPFWRKRPASKANEETATPPYRYPRASVTVITLRSRGQRCDGVRDPRRRVRGVNYRTLRLVC